MDATAIWTRTCELLKEEMTFVSYQTWIVNSLRMCGVEGDVANLECVMPIGFNIITTNYLVMIESALTAAVGRPMKAKLLSSEEARKIKTEQEEREKTPPPKTVDCQLNPQYTFDTFVVGNSNRFAHAASLAVAESPADAYNPLFLYGGVGLGKTHLMQAIGHYIRQQRPDSKLLYISSETFTNELISAIQTNTNVQFRNRFRNVDVLMVDDIQFIAGHNATQEEFFHTFNTLHTAGKQIIISSDRPPREIKRLEERLASRFEWGLIADIQKPDIETRIAILRQKCNRDHLSVSEDVLNMIAGRIDTNIRELEGSLLRVTAYARLMSQPVTVTLAEEALKDIIAVRDAKRITDEMVRQAVADYYGVNVQDIQSTKRNREIATPRQVAMYLCRSMTPMSLTQIGASFGKDHTTVMHAIEKVENDNSLVSTIEDLKQIIQAQ